MLFTRKPWGIFMGGYFKAGDHLPSWLASSQASTCCNEMKPVVKSILLPNSQKATSLLPCQGWFTRDPQAFHTIPISLGILMRIVGPRDPMSLGAPGQIPLIQGIGKDVGPQAQRTPENGTSRDISPRGTRGYLRIKQIPKNPRRTQYTPEV